MPDRRLQDKELPFSKSESIVGARRSRAVPNIFEVIRRCTSRTEPFHTRFLADSLNESLASDRRLFDAIWGLATGGDLLWPIPQSADVKEEERLESGGRIDIAIIDERNRRVVGIEGKTVEASTRDAQLDDYVHGLSAKYPTMDVRIAFLTPFNREGAGDFAESLSSVRTFDDFKLRHPSAVHVSWLEIAGIEWSGGILWEQHRAYVRDWISRRSILEPSRRARTRGLDEFLGAECVALFWDELEFRGVSVSDGVIDLQSVQDPEDLRTAFAHLLASDEIDRRARKADSYPDVERERMFQSPFGPLHRVLFDLANEQPFAWIQGRRDYGLRVDHPSHRSSGVSLARSRGDARLEVGELR